jgi:aspartate/glutamate racemase
MRAMPLLPPRIALIHATPLAVDPIQAAFARHWPAARRMNLLDDSLSSDRAEAATLKQSMVQRFIDLARYAQGTGCSGILFTCSAFGPAIEAAGRATGLPTLKPNEAMFAQALATRPGRLKLGLLATFEASIASMTWELQALAREHGAEVDLRSVFVPEAMGDLAQGHAAEHHRKIAAAAHALTDCDAVMLAQFSMAAAAPEVQAQLPCPVLSSPDCAVLALQQRMAVIG